MKLGARLSEDDVRVLDEYVRRTGLPWRSAAVQRAIRKLRHPPLEEDDGRAAAECWAGEDEIRDEVSADGLGMRRHLEL